MSSKNAIVPLQLAPFGTVTRTSNISPRRTDPGRLLNEASRSDAPVDRAGLAHAVAALRALGVERVFLGGQSYGGRQASMLAADEPALVTGLLLLSYPLHPPGRPAQLRTAHLPKLRGRVVFIHGTTDPFGSPEEIEAARALITAPTTLVLTDGGHDLGYRKPRRDLIERIVAACASWR